MLAILIPSMFCAHRSGHPPLPRSVRFLLVMSAAMGLTACWEAREFRYSSGHGVPRGDLYIAGSPYLAEPTRAWIAIFQREHPDVRIITHLDGAGAAAGAMAAGDADLAPMPRRMRAIERNYIASIGSTVRAVNIGSARAEGQPEEALFLYFGHGVDRASAVEFARIAISAEGQAELVRAGFAPLSRRSRREMSDLIEKLSEGEELS